MKEATGELNATIVVVLAVSVLIAFFYYTIWPVIKNNFDRNANCSKAICQPCSDPSGNCDHVDCYILNKDGSHSATFQCVYKG